MPITRPANNRAHGGALQWRPVRLIVRVLLNALALYVADYLLAGIALHGLGSALVGGLVLGLVNAIIRPILIVLTFPFTLLTLGLFIFVVNAICFGLAAALVPGFDVGGLWSALGGALIVSVVSWIVSAAMKEGRR
jgi:putative membrane protein